MHSSSQFTTDYHQKVHSMEGWAVQEMQAAANDAAAGDEAAALRAENEQLRDSVQHLGHAVEHAQVNPYSLFACMDPPLPCMTATNSMKG